MNSDGNLTFGGGDSRPGAARSEECFLSGLPRVAPLFTDLDPGQPGDDKDVKATTSDTEVTFSWENVPEFSSGVPRPGNLFSVTLFSNGDILFKYVSVNVTPDFPNRTTCKPSWVLHRATRLPGVCQTSQQRGRPSVSMALLSTKCSRV